MKRVILWAVYVFVLQIAFGPTAFAQERKLTILYSNDLHAHLEPQIVPWADPKRPIGGFANIATLVKREKAANPNTVYFDAGDFFTGPYISSLTKGEAIIDVMNYLGAGRGVRLERRVRPPTWQNALTQFERAKFPILNGNIFLKGTDTLFWNHPYLIMRVGGLRLGVIGLHERFAFYDTTSDEMVAGVEARDEKVYLRKTSTS